MGQTLSRHALDAGIASGCAGSGEGRGAGVTAVVGVRRSVVAMHGGRRRSLPSTSLQRGVRVGHIVDHIVVMVGWVGGRRSVLMVEGRAGGSRGGAEVS